MLHCVDLPEDVLVKILCRLPVKYLIRFTCVSKRWRSVITSDPQFAKSHLQLALQQGTLRHRVLTSAYYFYFELATPYHDVPTRFHSFEDNSSVRTLTYPTEENNYPHILVSCNGLVLLAEPTTSQFNLYIWNPTTRFSRKIPHLPESDLFSISLGHVSATDDYKVVLIPLSGSSGHVYSLREKIWKVVEVPPSHSWQWFPVGTYSNGAIHWVNYCTPENSERVIYAFDLANEEFGKVALPDSFQNGYDMNGRTIRTQVHLGGCLCVSSDADHGLIEFWVMTEYGVPESWVKLFQFEVRDLRKVSAHSYYGCSPIFVTEGGTVLMKFSDKMEFFKIERSKEGKLVCSRRYRLEEEVHGCKYISHATVYDETLVSIPE
ncbi:putative F-box domain, galactose oxidase/kelch, beta-propeller, F-box associated interaction [Rosa chinensis]|uniref:Putative F-box domain, galactose oxidase/kelch, beta-propeller, F-box associated interaction n=1 Tax=Rosa chinensis TaxID=74649 RepID=A0A2P6QLI6_ROSCH|nr:putative F-box domain, galactose oxidase/kelch, beta-propeller, F-box associated interaction [Rosa chinensis]